MKNLVLSLLLVTFGTAAARAERAEIYVVGVRAPHHFGPAVAIEFHRIRHSWTVVLAHPGDYFVQLGVNPGKVVSVSHGEAKEVKLPAATVRDTVFVRRLGRNDSLGETMQFPLWAIRRKMK
jgi:hypothetical protein